MVDDWVGIAKLMWEQPAAVAGLPICILGRFEMAAPLLNSGVSNLQHRKNHLDPKFLEKKITRSLNTC